MQIFNFDRNDRKHVLWLFRNMIKQFLLGNLSESKEALLWIKIHFVYKSNRVDNKLIIISGNSASGKSTILNKLSKNTIVSFTTREPRPGEKDGVDYQYISKEKYFELLNNGGLVEWTKYGGNYYGLTKQEIESKLNKGNAYVIVDYHGMKQLKELYPNNVSIFIYNDYHEAASRMKKRGDSDVNISKRLSTYYEEQKNRVHYDYVVKNSNGKLKETIKLVKQIIRLETGK